MTAAVLLVLHGLISALLLGAVTHQAIALWRRPAVRDGHFFAHLTSTRAGIYTNAILILYLVSFILGAILYTWYRVDVRPALEESRDYVSAWAFETKEHLSSLGLGLLPGYWLFWKSPALEDKVAARKYLTLLLTFYVWWNFLVGHVVNNVRGLPP